jgi:hypothetical protein
VTNALIDKYLLRAGLALVAVAFACSHPSDAPAPVATAPLPTASLAGQSIALLPLTLVAAEDSLRWNAALADRRLTLERADSILVTLLRARAPEVTWVGPDALRHAARRAPGLATDPDQMGTAIMRVPKLEIVPDPLHSQLRTLAALAGVAEYALIPAALIYLRPHEATGSSIRPGVGRAELTLVLADVRTGRVAWRTVARGEGDDPWTALTAAVKVLTPGLP